MGTPLEEVHGRLETPGNGICEPRYETGSMRLRPIGAQGYSGFHPLPFNYLIIVLPGKQDATPEKAYSAHRTESYQGR